MPPSDDQSTGSLSSTRRGRLELWCSCRLRVIFLIALLSVKTTGKPGKVASDDSSHVAVGIGSGRVDEGHLGSLSPGHGRGAPVTSAPSLGSTLSATSDFTLDSVVNFPQIHIPGFNSQSVERLVSVEVSPKPEESFYPHNGSGSGETESQSPTGSTKSVSLEKHPSSNDESLKSKRPSNTRNYYEFKCVVGRTSYFWFGGFGCRGGARKQSQRKRKDETLDNGTNTKTIKSQEIVVRETLSHNVTVAPREAYNKSVLLSSILITQSTSEGIRIVGTRSADKSTSAQLINDKNVLRTHRKFPQQEIEDPSAKHRYAGLMSFGKTGRELHFGRALSQLATVDSPTASKTYIIQAGRSETEGADRPDESARESVARHPIKTDLFGYSAVNGDTKSRVTGLSDKNANVSETILGRSGERTDEHIRQSKTDINTTIRSPSESDGGRGGGSPTNRPPAEESGSTMADVISKDVQRPPNEKSMERTEKEGSLSSSFSASSYSSPSPLSSASSYPSAPTSYSSNSPVSLHSSSPSSLTSSQLSSLLASSSFSSSPSLSTSSSLSDSISLSYSPLTLSLNHPSSILSYFHFFPSSPSPGLSSALFHASSFASSTPSFSLPSSSYSGLSSYQSKSSSSLSSPSLTYSPSPFNSSSSSAFPHKASADEIATTRSNPTTTGHRKRFIGSMRLLSRSSQDRVSHAAYEISDVRLPKDPNPIETINASTDDCNSVRRVGKNEFHGFLNRCRLRRWRKDLRKRNANDRTRNTKEKTLMSLLYDDQAVLPDSKKAEIRDRMKKVSDPVNGQIVMEHNGQKSGEGSKDDLYAEGDAKNSAELDSGEDRKKIDILEPDPVTDEGTASTHGSSLGQSVEDDADHYPIYNFNDAENRTHRTNATSPGFSLVYKSELVDERSEEIQGPQLTKTPASFGERDSLDRKRIRISKAALGIVGCGFCHPDEFQDWPEAERDFAWITACGIHMYGLGIAYLGLVVYLAFATVRFAVVCGDDGARRKRSVSLVALSMLIVAAATRGIFFLADGYNRNGSFSRTSACFLFNLIYPCLTVPFGLHLAGLSRMLNPDAPGRCGSRWPVILVAVHLAVTVVVDCLASLVDPRSFLLVVPQTTFSACACVLFSWFIYSYRTFSSLAGDTATVDRRRRESVSLDPSAMDLRTSQDFAAGLRVLFGSAVAGTFCVILAMFDVINAANRSVTAPWFLWLLGSVERVLELVVCAGLGCVTSKGCWALSVTLCHRKKNPTKNQPTSDRCMKILSSSLPCFWSYADTTKRSAADRKRSGRLLRLPWRFLKRRKRLSSGVASDETREVRLTGNGCFGQRSIGSKLPLFFSSSSSSSKAKGGDCGTDAAENNRFISPEATAVVRSRTAERYTDKRPRSSMLINDSGFIRFRLEGDPEGSPVADSTDDDLEANDCNGFPREESEKEQESASKRNTVEMDMCHRFPYSATITATATGGGGLASGPNDDDTAAWQPQTVDTPLTPLSLFSSADESSLNVFNFKLPSIHLRESIDRALNATGSLGRPWCYPAWRSSLDRLSVSTQPARDDDLRSTSDRFLILPSAGSQPSVSIHGRRSSMAAAAVPEIRSSVNAFFRSRSGSRATPRSSNGSLNMALCDQRYSVLERSHVGSKANLF